MFDIQNQIIRHKRKKSYCENVRNVDILTYRLIHGHHEGGREDMQAVTRVIKNTPVSGLQQYFDAHFKEEGAIINWQGN
jgi:hypothetical protein